MGLVECPVIPKKVSVHSPSPVLRGDSMKSESYGFYLYDFERGVNSYQKAVKKLTGILKAGVIISKKSPKKGGKKCVYSF